MPAPSSTVEAEIVDGRQPLATWPCATIRVNGRSRVKLPSSQSKRRKLVTSVVSGHKRYYI